jgi:hypothetical protein
MRCRPALTAAFAVVVLVVGQLAALIHAAETRHVECAEHGEQLEAVTLAGADDGCEHSHYIAVDGAGGHHEDCEILRALNQASDAPPQAPTSYLLVLAAAFPAPVVPLASATSELYRIAPKTSPPAAG